MWPKGHEIRWTRSEPFRKEGPPPPSRPGFGQSHLNVMQDGDRFYVGTSFVLHDGSEKPYTVDSEYFSSRKDAESMLSKMTGADIKEHTLRLYIREILATE